MSHLPDKERDFEITNESLSFLYKYQLLNDEQKKIVRDKIKELAEKAKNKNKDKWSLAPPIPKAQFLRRVLYGAFIL